MCGIQGIHLPHVFGSVIEARPLSHNVESRGFLLAGRGGDLAVRGAARRGAARRALRPVPAGHRGRLHRPAADGLCARGTSPVDGVETAARALVIDGDEAVHRARGEHAAGSLVLVGARARDRAAREALARGADRSQQHEREQREQKQQQQQQQRRRARPCVSPRSRRDSSESGESGRAAAARPCLPPRSAEDDRASSGDSDEARRRRRRPPPRRPDDGGGVGDHPPPSSRSRSTSDLVRRRALPPPPRPRPRGETSGASAPPAALAVGARPSDGREPTAQAVRQALPRLELPATVTAATSAAIPGPPPTSRPAPALRVSRARARSSPPVRGSEEISFELSRTGATPICTSRPARPPSARARPSEGRSTAERRGLARRRTAAAEAFPPPSVAASP